MQMTSVLSQPFGNSALLQAKPNQANRPLLSQKAVESSRSSYNDRRPQPRQRQRRMPRRPSASIQPATAAAPSVPAGTGTEPGAARSSGKAGRGPALTDV
ncbi:hypothetical protein CPLU01_02138 [Colletotrichum plurivorum]|uniref:Uncharacterized protein n=1 Tax=Colletotrichum plurivorum TaxID=2175906 RepID=A0A8H6KXB1_9PEZI|nr:hypothetical protein CPLU01_02138 [Colletotrichum plurivorum]